MYFWEDIDDVVLIVSQLLLNFSIFFWGAKIEFDEWAKVSKSEVDWIEITFQVFSQQPGSTVSNMPLF